MTIPFASFLPFRAALLIGLFITSVHADTLYSTNSGAVLKFNSAGVSSAFGFGWNRPSGLAFDSTGNLYIADNNKILKFTPGGAGSVFVGSGLNTPLGVAFDGADHLFVANAGNGTIVKFTPSGVGSLFASGVNGVKSLAFDHTGNLFVSSSGNTILKFTPDGTRSIFASTGLNIPYGLAFDVGGNLYVGNPGNNTIVKFTPSGVGSVFASGTGGLLDNTYGVAFDSAGDLYAANATNNTTIVKFTPAGTGSAFANQLSFPEFLAFTDDTGAPLSLPPKPPALRIVPVAPDSLQLRWPKKSASWTLETLANLPANSWVPIPGPYPTDGNDFVHQTQPAEQARFFHLRR